MQTTFSHPKFAIALDYPANGQPVDGYGSSELGDTRYVAINGFFQVGAMDISTLFRAVCLPKNLSKSLTLMDVSSFITELLLFSPGRKLI